MEIAEVRQQLTQRLDELASARGEALGRAPKFKGEELFSRLELGVLEIFDRVARELGDRATLDVIEHEPPAPQRSYRLTPRNPRAARIEAYPDSDDTVYLGIGVAGWEERWVGKTGLEEFLQDLEEDVRSLTDGGVEEMFWIRRGQSEEDVTASKLYVLRRGKLRRTGKIGVSRPLGRATRVHRKYEPHQFDAQPAGRKP